MWERARAGPSDGADPVRLWYERHRQQQDVNLELLSPTAGAVEPLDPKGDGLTTRRQVGPNNLERKFVRVTMLDLVRLPSLEEDVSGLIPFPAIDARCGHRKLVIDAATGDNTRSLNADTSSGMQDDILPEDRYCTHRRGRRASAPS